MSTTVRLATQSDIEQVQGLSLELFKDPTSASDKHLDFSWPMGDKGHAAFSDNVTKPDEALWVAEDRGKLVGFLSAGMAHTQEWRPIKRAELYSFYISPDYRSHGIGAQLCEQFFNWARIQKATTAFVEAYADNNRGINFYQKMGFIPETTRLEIEL